MATPAPSESGSERSVGAPHARAFDLDGEPASPVETLQTHISQLYLTPTRVYKLRKPVSLSFLDFSTRERRNADCEHELRLNRRMAPDVYLGLAPIEPGSGGWTLGPLRDALTTGAPGEPTPEHCVVMRRLADADNAQQRLAEGRLGGEEIDAIADRVARFHRDADLGRPAPFTATEWIEHLRKPIATCLAPDPGGVLATSRLRNLQERCEAVLRGRGEDFEARRRDGRAVEGHGDLQLQHFFLEPDRAEPCAIDCVEFDPALRRIDGASDIAFTSMDLRYRGHPRLAERLLSSYARARDDFHLYRVLAYYESYRAAVRARVAAIAAADDGLATSQREAAAESAEAHLRLAEQCLGDGSGEARLVVVCGGVGSGKSRMAELLGERLVGVVVGSDRTRKHLAGLAATERASGDALTALYSDERSEQVYAALLERADPILRSGRIAILDARYSTRAQRAEVLRFADKRGVDALLVEMECRPEIARARLEERTRRDDDPSDAGPDRLEWSRARFEPCDEWPSGARVTVENRDLESLSTAAEEVAMRLDAPTVGESITSRP